MSRSRIVFFLVSSMLVLPMLADTLLRAADRAEKPDEDSFYKYLSVFTEVLGLVRQAYVDAPDMDVLMSGALDGTTDALDPFSLYVPPNQVETYLAARAVSRRQSGLILLKEHGIVYVVATEKGSPAEQAGVKAGDIVAKVGEHTTRTMPLWEIQEALAAKVGTKVSLELIRLGEAVPATFELKPFDPPPVSLTEIEGVQLLRIPSFEKETASQVKTALEGAGAKTRQGLLIDLRGVSSGEPEMAYQTAELFANGDLGALLRRDKELETFQGQARPVWQGRIVILVDRSTLGAGEVLASVLRQKVKAELVGERTFGHAGRLGTAELSNGGRLLFTEAFFTGPDKAPLKDALKPDQLVDERSRTYLEKDVPMSELILRRGINRLLGNQDETAQKAA
ncbi:MAG TPA: S41 family peptidase [Thermoanaerobaculia bacterium]|jgi:carboxyl-terminal processing protease|nr:S41 family peptidase [Thermoanaerobaculia bacterium]